MAVLLLAILLVVFFQTLGYALGFLLFMVATLLILRVRSPLVVVGVPLATVIVVHFMFVGWFGLPLPAGLLRGIL
ncbi:hypothetical protein N177_0834 [Lutibaculum baratangense AMV1]|uniref:Tricarboxylate transport protein TctB n=1 Tax=Lutibaculum baratangense AMV1 TaxID=631454 RepID=V4RU45_9HYPH|nr:hypothetical protein N177_0834 [Lutibaculum baratangense AMV1]